ncbi:MAG: hydroxymethylbilane synthase [Flavobacteriales bacterium]
MKTPIIIGSRGSDLALWQAHFVQAELKKNRLDSRIEIIQTKGDAIQHLSFDKIEGKGFFTKEIEEALLQKRIDIAVHSHKDLETTSPQGLLVAAVSHRADPRELLLIHPDAVDESKPLRLKLNAIVGTSSARRKAQLLDARADIALKDIRGNVPTRVQKLRDRQFDAIMLAKAGIDRLELNTDNLIAVALNIDELVPAPAQGVLAIQCRDDDDELISALQAIHHPDVQANIAIERSVLNQLHGGCQLPLGVHAIRHNQQFHAHVAFATAWNQPITKFQVSGASTEEVIRTILHRINNR